MEQPVNLHFISVLNLWAGWTFGLMQYGHSSVC